MMMLKVLNCVFQKKLKQISLGMASVGVCALSVFTVNAAHAGPQIERWALSNGAQVYLVQSDVLPMLDVHIAFDAGSRRDPSDKVGLASFAALMGDKGVSAGQNAQAEPALNENEITDAWLDLGAVFGASSSRDEFSYSLRTLTYPDVLPQAVTLASRVLAQPSFPEDVLKRDQMRMSASLQESLTKPATIASRTFNERLYSGHPYGAQMTEASIQALTVRDLQVFHATYILPCRARIAMVGNVSKEQANEIATQLLARLPEMDESCAPLPAVAEVPELKQAFHEEIAFEAAQAQIYMGQPGIKRDDPDFLVLVVANHILGGNGFSSKLMQEVREDRGLTYGVGSYFSPGAHAGAFTISLKTRPDQAQEALKVSLQVLDAFVKNGPSQEELKAAKANLMGGFPLMFDSNAKLLAQVANIARNDLPLDYLEQWPLRIEAVTAEQIKAAMQRVINPEHLVTVVVGGK